jgi:hypothetical protein
MWRFAHVETAAFGRPARAKLGGPVTRASDLHHSRLSPDMLSKGCFLAGEVALFYLKGGTVKPRPDTRRVCVGCITLCLCVLLCGCIGATRLPVRASGPAGVTIQKNEIDLSFLHVGATQREEVKNQLASINTSYSNPRLFWGRWSESRWGYWWVVGMPCNNCMAGDAHRKWHIQNLLVTFDENGFVTSKEAISDDGVLWRSLHSHMLDGPSPSLDLSQPIRIELTTPEPTAILLGKDKIELEQSDREAPNVQISVANVVRFSHARTLNIKGAPGTTCHALEFSEKTAFGKKIKFCAEANQIGTLFQYLQQVGPPGMTWQ